MTDAPPLKPVDRLELWAACKQRIATCRECLDRWSSRVGTLTRFRMGDLAREVFADRVAPAHMERFIADFTAYRFDEVLGAWKPYADVIENALRRACHRWRIEYPGNEGGRFYDAVPTWGPHADVPEALARVAQHYPLVILSNASDDQTHRSRPVHRREAGHRVRRGKVAAVAETLLGGGAEVLDATGALVTPGLIATRTFTMVSISVAMPTRHPSSTVSPRWWTPGARGG